MIKTASSLAEHKAVIVFRHNCMKKQFSSQLWVDEAVEHRMMNSKVFMAFCPTTGELVGSAEIFNVGRQRGAHYLQNLVVSESYRRRGVAAALLQTIILHGTGDIYLDVDRDNEAALALYAKFGFIEHRTRWRQWLHYFVINSRKLMIRKSDQKD
jgi:ribosomal protein S18 acetylase RimI-like enzyme